MAATKKNDDPEFVQMMTTNHSTCTSNKNQLKHWILDARKSDDDVPDHNDGNDIDIDMDTLFDDIDTNRGGTIQYDEFCAWALQTYVDLKPPVTAATTNRHHGGTSKQKHSKPKQQHNNNIVSTTTTTKSSFMEDLEATMKLLDDQLPYQKNNKDAYQKRMKQFRAMDVNGNGYLSLAEIDLGMKTVVGIPQLFETKPVLIRAYNAAKNKAPGKFGNKDNYVTKNEYRYLLYCLRQYYEY